MSEEISKPDAIAALRERLFELNHQRDLTEMAMREIDARIAEINGMLQILDPPAKRMRGRPKGQGMRIVTVPEPATAGPDDVFPPEDAA